MTTPTHKYRPRWIDRCLYRRRYWLRNIGWTLLIVLACIGLWSVITAESRVYEATARAMKAEADRQEVLSILEGRVSMKSPLGSEYERVACVRWDTYKIGTGQLYRRKNDECA